MIDRSNTTRTKGSPTGDAEKTPERSYTVTHIRPGDEEDIDRDVVHAPGRAAAALRAQVLFPGSRILAIQPLTESAGCPGKQDLLEATGIISQAHAGTKTADKPTASQSGTATGTHGARFIRGLFRPALFHDEFDIEALPE